MAGNKLGYKNRKDHQRHDRLDHRDHFGKSHGHDVAVAKGGGGNNAEVNTIEEPVCRVHFRQMRWGICAAQTCQAEIPDRAEDINNHPEREEFGIAGVAEFFKNRRTSAAGHGFGGVGSDFTGAGVDGVLGVCLLSVL